MMDSAERFTKKTEALILLKEHKGIIKPVLERMGITKAELTDLVGKDELSAKVRGHRKALEDSLLTSALGGDTKAAEVLLAAKHPEIYDARIRYESWKQKERESGATLPDIIFEVIEKSTEE